MGSTAAALPILGGKAPQRPQAAAVASASLEYWLTTNKAVAEMEDKLPREERLEWAKYMSVMEGESNYDKFNN